MAETTVTVACKLPNGLHCEVADIKFESIGENTVATKQNIRTFFLRGSAQARVLDNNERIGEHPDVIGGYGITQVPKDLWERWYAENFQAGENKSYTFPPLAAGLIFANPRPDATKKMAAERATQVRSGLEPIKPTITDDAGRVVSGDVDPRTRFGNQVVAEEPVSAAQRRQTG